MNFSHAFEPRNASSRRGERGSIFTLISLFILILVAMLGLAADWGRTLNQSRHIQNAADAGVLAGVNRLIPPNVDAGLAANDARAIAQANGLTAAEISAVQVGHWDGSVFAADTTPYNSVRLTASRQVKSMFMRLVGTNSLTPDVEAMALIGERSSGDCLVPLAVELQGLLDPDGDGVYLVPGDEFVISRQDNPGNWGVVTLDPLNDGNQGGPTIEDLIRNGRCGLLVETGHGPGYDPDHPHNTGYTTDPGNGQQVCNGLNYRLSNAPEMTIPVVNQIDNGDDHVEIMNFLRVRLLSTGSKNSNYSNGSCSPSSKFGARFRVLEPASGGGEPGGPAVPPFETARILVK